MATLLCPAALNSLWKLASSICNFKASGSALESFGPCVCVCPGVCVCVCARAFACAWLITHLRPIGEPRPLTPLCALDEWGDKRTHPVMRSQIIYLAFDQEGLTGEKQERMARRRREERRGEEETKGITANESVNVGKLQKEGRRQIVRKKGVCLRDGERKKIKMRAVEMLLCVLIRMAERFYCPKLYNEQPSV